MRDHVLLVAEVVAVGEGRLKDPALTYSSRKGWRIADTPAQRNPFPRAASCGPFGTKTTTCCCAPITNRRQLACCAAVTRLRPDRYYD